MIIKEDKKYRNSPTFLIVLSLISFCFFGWYYNRGSSFLMGYNFPVFTHEIFAFIIGGIVPAIIFELMINLFTIKSRMVRIQSGAYDSRTHLSFVAPTKEVLDVIMAKERKKISTLRIFVIGANLTCFILSFIYFKYRMLYVYGRVLLNFVVSLLFFIGYLFYQLPKTEKNKQAFTLSQIAKIFLATHCTIVVLEIALSIA